MTADEFRTLALNLPQATEKSHMGPPDFRVVGKIFATLGPDEMWGMVKLTPEQQASFVRIDSAVFHPANGAWGRGGATIVRLRDADALVVEEALKMAWRNTAPQRLVQKYDEHGDQP